MENTIKTQSIYSLVELILKDLFSKEVSEIGKDLLYNGVSTIPEIQKRLKMTFENVKNVLIILLQNKLCSCSELTRNNVKVIGYELEVDNVIHTLLFPKMLLMVNDKYGENGVMIFEEFMQFGILSAFQVFEQVKNRIEMEGKRKINESNMNKIKLTFIKLIESNWIIQAKLLFNMINQNK